MYSNASVYRKSDNKLIHSTSSNGWNVRSLTFTCKREMEAKGLNFDNCYVMCLDNQNHTASKPHHIVDGRVKRYNPKKK